jgi:hypothetical protein
MTDDQTMMHMLILSTEREKRHRNGILKMNFVKSLYNSHVFIPHSTTISTTPPIVHPYAPSPSIYAEQDASSIGAIAASLGRLQKK